MDALLDVALGFVVAAIAIAAVLIVIILLKDR